MCIYIYSLYIYKILFFWVVYIYISIISIHINLFLQMSDVKNQENQLIMSHHIVSCLI